MEKGILPSVQELIKESWETFTKIFLNFFLFNLYAFLAMLGLVVLGIIILAIGGVGIGAIFTGITQGELLPTLLQTSGLFLIVFLLILFSVTLFIAGIVLRAALILLIHEKKEELHFKELVKKSLPFVVPLLAASVVSGLMTAGGLVFLIIPGVLFSLYFSLSSYIVVLEKQRGIDSLRRSMFLVTNNFWPMIIRLLPIIALYILLTIAFKDLPGLQFIANTILGWFALVYYIVLYQHLSKDSKDGKSSLKWVLVVSLLGWILLIGATVAAIRFIPFNNLYNNNQFSTTTKKETILRKDIEDNIFKDFKEATSSQR